LEVSTAKCHCHFHSKQTVRTTASKVFSPSSSHYVVLHRWCAVDAAESGWTSWDVLLPASDLMAHHTDKWLRSTIAEKPLFHASSGRCCSAWQRARSRWASGTAAAVDAAWCAEQKHRHRHHHALQQVTSNVCSLSASSTLVTQLCSTCMPSTMSYLGRKATHVLVIHKGGNVRMCKKAGG